MSEAPPAEPPHETRRARRFGWTSLLGWALLGTALEAAHGFKLAAYLDDELTRLLLRLAHAHGVGLSLLVLVYSSAGVPLLSPDPAALRSTGLLLRVGSVCLPLGFLLGALFHPEGDPSVGIVLSPLGALCVLGALARLTRAAFRAPP